MDKYSKGLDILCQEILGLDDFINSSTSRANEWSNSREFQELEEEKLKFEKETNKFPLETMQEACDKANKYDYLTMILKKCQVLETPNGIYLGLHSGVEDFEGKKLTLEKIIEEDKNEILKICEKQV